MKLVHEIAKRLTVAVMLLGMCVAITAIHGCRWPGVDVDSHGKQYEPGNVPYDPHPYSTNQNSTP